MPTIKIPTLHAGQVAIHRHNARFKSILCGRRWGKSEYLLSVAEDGAARGLSVGYFVPEYKFLSEFYERIAEDLQPIKRKSSKNEGVFRTQSGGRIDFWSLENPLAGRSRKYHKVLIDEAAFAKNNTMSAQWDRAIQPTLLDYVGDTIVASTPHGIDDENWFYRICHDPKLGFTVYHAPTSSNPYMPAQEIERLRLENHPLVFQQEYLAQFVDWSSAAFFSRESLLVDGQPVPMPAGCDYVFAIIDSAVKAGQEHDGTGVVYCAVSKFFGHKLVILDWDLVQIEGALLETWLPNIFDTLESLARQCKARLGSAGVWIEDKASGSILLQQAATRGWNAQAIDSKLTSHGKDERAINASGPVFRGEVKISEQAYNRTSDFKRISRNHLLHQVLTFRPGDKDAAKRADDLLDCFTYAVALALGNNDGF